MKKKIIYLLPYKFKSQYIQQYDIDNFSKLSNISVEIHELIEFLYPHFIKAHQKKTNYKNLKTFNSLNSWKKRMFFLKKKYQNNILVINTARSVDFKSFNINLFLKIEKFKTLEYKFAYSDIDTLIKQKKLILFIKIIKTFFFNYKKFLYYFQIYIFSKLKNFFFISPDFILYAGKINKNLISNKIKLIEGNFPDYNSYLNTKNKIFKKIKAKKFALFVEPSTPLTPGDTVLTQDDSNVWGDKNLWFKDLNDFFNLIEKKFNLEIKIAPHPKVEHKNKRPSYYFGREIIKDNLFEIAKYSKFFISRTSTAMCLPIILNKPAIFVTNDKIISGHKYIFQKFYASEFGKKPINISRKINKINKKEFLKINKKKYKEFVRKYLTTRKDCKKNYEIIVNLILNT